MCTFKIDGVILRIIVGSDFDARVAVLTQRLGRLNLLARRLNRPSKLRGSLLALTPNRFILRRMPNSSVVRIEECERLAVFPELVSYYPRFVCASYISELLLLSVPEWSSCPELYDLLLPTLISLSSCRDPRAVTFAAELKILSALGYSPCFSHCVACEKPHAKGRARFLICAGGIICPNCWSENEMHYEGGTSIRLSAGAVAFAKMAVNKPMESLRSASISRPLGRELLRLLTRYKAYHLQLHLNSAKLLASISN